MSSEIRTTSSTGGQKGAKLQRFDLIPIGPLRELAEHYGVGASKYADHNYRRGYPWSLSYSALCRHLTDFWAGKDYDVCSNDPEGCRHTDMEGNPFVAIREDACFNHTGSHHMVAAAWHAFGLLTFKDEHVEFDDRFKPEVAPEPVVKSKQPDPITLTWDVRDVDPEWLRLVYGAPPPAPAPFAELDQEEAPITGKNPDIEPPRPEDAEIEPKHGHLVVGDRPDVLWILPEQVPTTCGPAVTYWAKRLEQAYEAYENPVQDGHESDEVDYAFAALEHAMEGLKYNGYHGLVPIQIPRAEDGWVDIGHMSEEGVQPRFIVGPHGTEDTKFEGLKIDNVIITVDDGPRFDAGYLADELSREIPAALQRFHNRQA